MLDVIIEFAAVDVPAEANDCMFTPPLALALLDAGKFERFDDEAELFVLNWDKRF